ncbi:3-methyl-2-oxobutanoate hydroxymethyltransferase PanB [Coprinopsis cinerea okayama7|uniref:3-methyl-2-oxobutanoate hydroxymethyltransferase n=1 Tax=Coprinopsis cinerea (strain Okayama-7 / 130 / ATCC MYA-4618 / FGSC 9003) TaxID=240176 RepID=A8NPY9_COPC7|nr:3-methyl-2-oxobutanoate hydroxymethyltransferase PanB [Coprinopsis cinerea okayama7\|eukprot:XP_001835436.1 3-methyl-2-oxobutanoate hydroxymethyltransferase PanB [Coprinopsis cinerea okayama7\
MSTTTTTLRMAYGLNRVSRAGLQLRLTPARRWMSVRPPSPDAQTTTTKTPTTPASRKKVTIQTLHSLRQSKTPITMVTAYDYPTALACSSSPLTDITLVGDSLAQVCLGYSSTTQLSLDEMIHHARAVSRGNKHPLLVADMPFGSYQVSVEDAIRNAVRLVREAGVEAVKLEGGQEIVEVVRRLTEVGIPVMAHVGLLPQRHASLSGYRVQGRSIEGAKRLLEDALALQDAGAFSMVVEAVPRELGTYITERLNVPTIGIGAGPGTSGQVLVIDDIMGTWSGHKAKFVRRFANLKAVRDNGIQQYCEAVRNGSFPDPESESYTMDPALWEQFLASQK